MRALLLGLASAVGVLFASAGHAQDHPASWSRPAEPFRILGNIHYVGTEGLSAFLITGPNGHVLIDGGLPSSAPMIAANITKLGFKPGDVKQLLINHSHYDHAGGLAELKRLTGAQMVASAGDKPDLEAGKTVGREDLEGFPAVKVDRVIADGDQVRVGPVVLTAMLTPGHTTGATSWTTVAEGKRVIFTSSVTVAGQKLVNNARYPGAVADFRRTFARLRATPADVFLNFHSEGFGLPAKRARQLAGAADAFVDPGELARRTDAAQAAFETELAQQTAAAKGD
jgi:metallo-beta-lactamase class B